MPPKTSPPKKSNTQSKGKGGEAKKMPRKQSNSGEAKKLSRTQKVKKTLRKHKGKIAAGAAAGDAAGAAIVTYNVLEKQFPDYKTDLKKLQLKESELEKRVSAATGEKKKKLEKELRKAQKKKEEYIIKIHNRNWNCSQNAKSL